MISKTSDELNLDNLYNKVDLSIYHNIKDSEIIKYKHENYKDFLENKSLSLRLKFEKDSTNYIKPEVYSEKIVRATDLELGISEVINGTADALIFYPADIVSKRENWRSLR